MTYYLFCYQHNPPIIKTTLFYSISIILIII
nr:MAG TPA: hypothetical protein [Caudoviricetes sp.]DAV41801.1 MAG TPA: hypothetical protein [Bacteriophage sp.]